MSKASKTTKPPFHNQGMGIKDARGSDKIPTRSRPVSPGKPTRTRPVKKG